MSSAPSATPTAVSTATLEERVAALETALALPPALLATEARAASSGQSQSTDALRTALARQNYRILHLVRALDHYQARALAAEAALAQHQQQTR